MRARELSLLALLVLFAASCMPYRKWKERRAEETPMVDVADTGGDAALDPAGDGPEGAGAGAGSGAPAGAGSDGGDGGADGADGADGSDAVQPLPPVGDGPTDVEAEIARQDALGPEPGADGVSMEAELRGRIARRPDDAKLYYVLGRLLGNTGPAHLEKAGAAFDKALELDPKLGWAHHGKGMYLHKKGDTAGAVAEFEKALDLDPDRVLFIADLAREYHLTDRRADALTLLERAIGKVEAPARNARLRGEKAKMLVDAGERKAAIAVLEKALDVDPKSYDIYMYLARQYMLDGQDEKAIDTYRRLEDEVEDPTQRALAARRIAYLTDAIEKARIKRLESTDDSAQVLAHLSSDTLDLRRAAYRKVVEWGRLIDLKHLYLGLADEDRSIRKTCVLGLAASKDPGVVPVLVRVLKLDTHYLVRGEAAGALPGLARVAVLPDLLASLKLEQDRYVIEKIERAIIAISETRPRHRIDFDDLEPTREKAIAWWRKWLRERKQGDR